MGTGLPPPLSAAGAGPGTGSHTIGPCAGPPWGGVALLWAASWGVAKMVNLPSPPAAVFQAHEWGARVAGHSVAPPAVMVTVLTPTLSAAEAATVTVPDTVEPFAGALMLTV